MALSGGERQRRYQQRAAKALRETRQRDALVNWHQHPLKAIAYMILTHPERIRPFLEEYRVLCGVFREYGAGGLYDQMIDILGDEANISKDDFIAKMKRIHLLTRY